MEMPHILLHNAEQLFRVLTQLYRSTAYLDPNARALYHQPKDLSSNNGGEFGYYITPSISALFLLIQELKVKSFLDLGAGAGILLLTLNALVEDLRVHGYENEVELIRQHTTWLGGRVITRKDILTLNKEDIKYFQALYFWDPFRDFKLTQQFINNLASIMDKKQIIINKNGSYCTPALKSHPNFKTYESNHFEHFIFRLK